MSNIENPAHKRIEGLIAAPPYQARVREAKEYLRELYKKSGGF